MLLDLMKLMQQQSIIWIRIIYLFHSIKNNMYSLYTVKLQQETEKNKKRTFQIYISLCNWSIEPGVVP